MRCSPGMLFLTRTFALSRVRVVLSAVISSSVHGFGSLRLASFLPTRKTRWARRSQQRRAQSKVLFTRAASTMRFLQRRRAPFIFICFPERTGFCPPTRVLIRKTLLSPDRDFSTGHAQPSASPSQMTTSKLLTRFLMHFTKSSNQSMKPTPKVLTHSLPLISTCRFAHLCRSCPHDSIREQAGPITE